MSNSEDKAFKVETKYTRKLSNRAMRRFDRAVEAVQADIENGRFHTGTVDEHMERLFKALDQKKA